MSSENYNPQYFCFIKVPSIIRPYTLAGKDEMEIRIPSISDAKEGFWINQSLKHTQGSDALFWVPPTAVLCVRKTQ
jgi:hypothetical protein